MTIQWRPATPQERAELAALTADTTLCRKGLHHVHWPNFMGGGLAWGGRCKQCRRASQNANNINRYVRDLRKRIAQRVAEHPEWAGLSEQDESVRWTDPRDTTVEVES